MLHERCYGNGCAVNERSQSAVKTAYATRANVIGSVDRMKNLAIVLLVVTAACSDDSEPDYEFVPITSSTLDGHLRGEEMTFEAGIATNYTSGAPIFIFGEGNITCETFGGDTRPPGTYAYVVFPGPIGTQLSVGTFEGAFVSLENRVGRSQSIAGSDDAILTIASITETAVAGSISFTYVVEGEEIGALNGDFEVTRCPQ